jgi:cupin fold WbuC family metalloprotein
MNGKILPKTCEDAMECMDTHDKSQDCRNGAMLVSLGAAGFGHNGGFSTRRRDALKQITPAALDELSRQAAQSPRLRANLNLHQQLSDPVQRLAIAMEPGTYVRPHRHPHTWELLQPLRGRFLVLHFDEGGTVTARTVLGEDCQVLENPAGSWHAVLSLDAGGVIFEVKLGPYQPLAEDDQAPWSPSGDDAMSAELMAWYATAKVGDCLAAKQG